MGRFRRKGQQECKVSEGWAARTTAVREESETDFRASVSADAGEGAAGNSCLGVLFPDSRGDFQGLRRLGFQGLSLLLSSPVAQGSPCLVFTRALPLLLSMSA